jgi:hypothetical protein
VSLRRDVLAESFGGRNVVEKSSALLHYLGSCHLMLPCLETQARHLTSDRCYAVAFHGDVEVAHEEATYSKHQSWP